MTCNDALFEQIPSKKQRRRLTQCWEQNQEFEAFIIRGTKQAQFLIPTHSIDEWKALQKYSNIFENDF